MERGLRTNLKNEISGLQPGTENGIHIAYCRITAIFSIIVYDIV